MAKALSVCQLSAVAVALIASAAPTGARARTTAHSRATGRAGQGSVYSVRVRRFAVSNADMEEALHALRRQDVSRILIGFERIPHRQGEADHRISLALTDASPVEIVRRLCEADVRYDYNVIQGSVIGVWPRGAKKDQRSLLNAKIRYYSVNRPEFPESLIEQIGWQAPELRRLLTSKQEEWAKNTGRRVGVAGSVSSGNVPPPTFTLHVGNATVREILNAIALHSLEMFRQGKLSGPTGWEYDFVIDPNAYTGLGGYPRWTAF